MKIGLLGYGKMGKAIEEIAMERGHEIIFIRDKEITEGELNKADVAINFSIPESAIENIKEALQIQVPVVCGTTGWLSKMSEIEQFCIEKDSAFLYASNFSIGVNLFFKLNQITASLMKGHESEYSLKLNEIHHIHKLDAPSGTAISLAEDIIEVNPFYSKWTLNGEEDTQLPITSERLGEVPGTHTLTYSSEVDEIKIEHIAHSRKGFALGAVIAAEWIADKKGIFSMSDVLNL